MRQTWTWLQPAAVMRLQPGAPRTVFPDVRCDLVWRDDGWTLSGPQSRPRFEVVSRPGLLVSLEPSAARRLLGTPLRELVDVTAPVEAVSSALARKLTDAMSAADTAAAPAPRDLRLEAAERALRAGASVGAAADAASLSIRQLERWFAAEMGLTPKAFVRITRFRRACDWLRRGASLAAAAAESGYADQSHFARDCRSLGDITPAALRRRVANVQDIVRGDFAGSA